tara:strand:- start:9228 stop:9881 length:654 start_codon:yes stop_codon:yes gene_type:complete
MFNDLCPPALIYLVFSFTQIVIDTIKGYYNMATMKLWVAFVFTILLNYLCQSGLGIISWIIVFIPFILMTIIVGILLVVFGLDPRTGKLRPKEKSKTCINVTPEERKKLDEIKKQNTSQQSNSKNKNKLDTSTVVKMKEESKKECELYLRQVADILYNMNENFKASILTNQIPDCLNNKTKEECIICAKSLINLTEKELSEDKRRIFIQKKNAIKIY